MVSVDYMDAIYGGGQLARAALNQLVQGSSPWWITSTGRKNRTKRAH
jgi:hypothetical protein